MTGTGGAASFAKCFQTSRSAVICEPGHLSLNLFVFNLPGLIADVRALPEYLDGWKQSADGDEAHSLHSFVFCFFFLYVYESCAFHTSSSKRHFVLLTLAHFVEGCRYSFLSILIGLHTLARTGLKTSLNRKECLEVKELYICNRLHCQFDHTLTNF